LLTGGKSPFTVVESVAAKTPLFTAMGNAEVAAAAMNNRLFITQYPWNM
jgi:hypothetical protein